MNETALVQQCIDYLTMNGVYAWRNNIGARGNIRFGKTGSADILGIMPSGRFIAVECKIGKNFLSASQIEFMGKIRANNGTALVVHAVEDLEGLFKKQIKEVSNGN